MFSFPYLFLEDCRSFTKGGKVIGHDAVAIAAAKGDCSAQFALENARNVGVCLDVTINWDRFCFHPRTGFTDVTDDGHLEPVERSIVIKAAGEGNPFALNALDEAYNPHWCDRWFSWITEGLPS